jgi:transcription antitermination factor NusG
MVFGILVRFLACQNSVELNIASHDLCFRFYSRSIGIWEHVGMPWAVIETHSNSANVAARNLRAVGEMIYNPMISVRVRTGHSRPHWVRSQLFPNYLFVKLLKIVRNIPSVRGLKRLLVGAGGEPAWVDSEFVRDLRAMENPKTGLIILRPKTFIRGDAVKIRRGALELQSVLYDGQKDDERSFVLMNVLGARRRLVVDSDNLIAA